MQFQGNDVTCDGFVELLEEELFVLFLELCIRGRVVCCRGIRCVDVGLSGVALLLGGASVCI